MFRHGSASDKAPSRIRQNAGFGMATLGRFMVWEAGVLRFSAVPLRRAARGSRAELLIESDGASVKIGSQAMM
jgi:hypothetical protein